MGLVNSAQVHYSQLTCQQLRAEQQQQKKRREKRKTQNVNAKLIWIQMGTKFLWIKQHPIAWIWDRRFHDGDGDLDGAVVEGSRVVVGV